MEKEKELFVPYIAANLGSSMEEVKSMQAKLEAFGPTAKVNTESVKESKPSWTTCCLGIVQLMFW